MYAEPNNTAINTVSLLFVDKNPNRLDLRYSH